MWLARSSLVNALFSFLQNDLKIVYHFPNTVDEINIGLYDNVISPAFVYFDCSFLTCSRYCPGERPKCLWKERLK